MKSRNWFWGLFFLLAAVFVVVSQTVGFGQLGFWGIAATVLLAALFIHSLIELNYFGIFLPLAFLYKIYMSTFNLPDISIWLLLLAAVLASTGCEMLFHKHHKWNCCTHDYHKVNRISENIDDNHPSAKVSFGASSQYLHGNCIENGEFASSFGELDVYFDQAQLSPSGADIYIDCSFGAIKLYVPKSWPVRDSIHASLGAVDNTHISQPDTALPALTLNGDVRFGAVEIHYI